DGEATYRFPLVVAPRYIPGAALPGDQVGSGTAADTDAVPDASRITPPVLLPGFPNPVRLTAEVDVAPAGLPVAEVRSSLHGVVVLVLDRSGSMDGWKMAAARRAAGRIVDTLTKADRFAVLAFDDVVETPPNLPPGLVPAVDRNRFRAVEHLASMEARGGTE